MIKDAWDLLLAKVIVKDDKDEIIKEVCKSSQLSQERAMVEILIRL